MMRVVSALVLCALAGAACAADGELVSLPTRSGVTQRIYVETATAHPPWVVVLFGGNGGNLHLTDTGATTLKGNFLIRTANYWVDRGDATVLFDVPSDVADADDIFRLGTDAYEDIKATVAALRQRFPQSRIALVGTSRGTASVGNALRRDPALADAWVLTSPVALAYHGALGIADLDVDGTRYRVLVVSNRHDGCPTSYAAGGMRLAERNHFALMLVDSTEGGGNRKADCGGHSPHGFLGIEQQVLGSINDWLNGQALQAR
ncbi:conserved exported protein of unknown function [Burkholderia multivorans]